MNKDIDKIFKARLSIHENSSQLHSYGTKYQKVSNTGQMSLFGSEETTTKPKIKTSNEETSRLGMAMAESDLIGLCMSYDYMDEYLIHKMVYATHSVKDVESITKNTKNIVTIGLVTKVFHSVSVSGKQYMKVHIYDNGTEIYIYISGKEYNKYKALFIMNRVYMFQLKVSGEKNYINIMSAITPEEVEPNNRFNSVNIIINDKSYIKQIRSYVFNNMFGNGDKSLMFIIEGLEVKSSFKITISNKDIVNLNKMRCIVHLDK